MAADLKKLFEGTWTYYKSDNFEQYLDKLDVGAIKKKLATSMTPTMKVRVEDPTITVSMSAGPRTHSNTFTLGTPFDIEMEMSGTGVASFYGGVWTIQVTPKDPKKAKSQTVTRKVIDGELVQYNKGDNRRIAVTCRRYNREILERELAQRRNKLNTSKAASIRQWLSKT